MCNVKVWNWSSISGLGEKATYPPKMEESSVAAKSAENSGKDDRTNERKDAEQGSIIRRRLGSIMDYPYYIICVLYCVLFPRKVAFVIRISGRQDYA